MIRVMIERQCQPGKEEQLKDLLLELRIAGVRQYGYISGETLREAGHPSTFMVISTWVSVEDWTKWQTARPRMLIADMIASLLTAEEKIRIFQEVHDI
ncbi:MAG: Antibiotic biosynthesis monooxygenase [Syntrophaceae bacterium PtaU1.Bin231]|nr:MAG: Antibiotic biosynthesis monooxygenase [Syntrophaceae bacterium PtaU1.Bin231]